MIMPMILVSASFEFQKVAPIFSNIIHLFIIITYITHLKLFSNKIMFVTQNLSKYECITHFDSSLTATSFTGDSLRHVNKARTKASGNSGA